MRMFALALPFSLALSLGLAPGCDNSERPTGALVAPATAATTSASGRPSARQLMASGAVVLDVRTPDEHAQGHLPNDVLIPVQELGQRMAEVEQLVGGDKAKPVVVYCRSGSRAGRAKGMLEAAGFTNVVNGGGYDQLR